MDMSTTSPERRQFQVLRGSASSTPNQHPYAIKTTSTALLTRSNSSGHAVSAQHVYVPAISSPSSKHRYTKSDLARPAPRPLPVPPALDSSPKDLKGHGHTNSEELLFPSHRTRRADTLPSTSTPPPPSPVKVDDLPSNPRVWTTSQLSSYLITALRVRSGESLPLPLPVAKDIAAFVKDARLNGRAFVRLNEQDLESMGINNLWREALLNASRNLRQNVLRGRIWSFGADDDENSFISPYRLSSYNSSSSSIDEASDSQEITPNKSSGRVRGLVASLERSSNSGCGLSNHGSLTSEGDALSSTWPDDEAMFASGSEASDADDRKSRAIMRKRLIREPVIPPPEASPEMLVNGKVAGPESEPTIEELLTSSSLSRSWGAKAWEDIDVSAGVTVKRIPPNKEGEDVARKDLAHPGNSSESGSGRGIGRTAGHDNDRKFQIKEMFSRPLPKRPLPTPPKSGSSSPRLQKLVTDIPVEIKEKLGQIVQVDTEPRAATVRVQQLAEVSGTTEAEKLQHALTLLGLFRARLAEVEKKLDDLERNDAEQAKIVHRSQAVETDASLTHMTLRESMSLQAECAEAEANFTSTSNFIRVKDADDGTEQSPLSALVLPPTSTGTVDGPSSERESKRECTGYCVWDPLESGIPSYILMVGVGVCAVVLSTLLKRLGGKKS